MCGIVLYFVRQKVGCGRIGSVVAYVVNAVSAVITSWVVLYVEVGSTMLRRDGVALGVAVGWSETIHSPILVHFAPLIMIFPLYLMVTLILVNVVSHPASHSAITEIRECDARPGRMYPVRALVGSWGRPSVHCWVDLTLFPSESVNVICCVLLSTNLTCASVIRSCWLLRSPKLSIV